jgi:hypothetical protein
VLAAAATAFGGAFLLPATVATEIALTLPALAAPVAIALPFLASLHGSVLPFVAFSVAPRSGVRGRATRSEYAGQNGAGRRSGRDTVARRTAIVAGSGAVIFPAVVRGAGTLARLVLALGGSLADPLGRAALCACGGGRQAAKAETGRYK